jgi:hypothetical protein
MNPQQIIDAIELIADPSVAACCWCQSNEEGKDNCTVLDAISGRQPVKVCNMRACPLGRACVPTGLGQPCFQGLGDAACLLCMLGAVSFYMSAVGVQPALD